MFQKTLFCFDLKLELQALANKQLKIPHIQDKEMKRQLKQLNIKIIRKIKKQQAKESNRKDFHMTD